jgi:hypothetical protein
VEQQTALCACHHMLLQGLCIRIVALPTRTHVLNASILQRCCRCCFLLSAVLSCQVLLSAFMLPLSCRSQFDVLPPSHIRSGLPVAVAALIC